MIRDDIYPQLALVGRGHKVHIAYSPNRVYCGAHALRRSRGVQRLPIAWSTNKVTCAACRRSAETLIKGLTA